VTDGPTIDHVNRANQRQTDLHDGALLHGALLRERAGQCSLQAPGCPTGIAETQELYGSTGLPQRHDGGVPLAEFQPADVGAITTLGLPLFAALAHNKPIISG
jgi:hypothetical protein